MLLGVLSPQQSGNNNFVVFDRNDKARQGVNVRWSPGGWLLLDYGSQQAFQVADGIWVRSLSGAPDSVSAGWMLPWIRSFHIWWGQDELWSFDLAKG